MLAVLFKGLKEIKDKGLGVDGKILLQNKLVEKLQKQKHISCVRAMFEASKGYLFGYLSVLDFLVYQKTFYATNIICNIPYMQIPQAFVKFF